MFLCINESITLMDLYKKKDCKERKDAKVDIFMCLLKIRTNTIDYCRFIVNNRYNT